MVHPARSAQSDWESRCGFGKLLCCEMDRTGERDKLLRVMLTAKGQHQAQMEVDARLLGRPPRFTGNEAEWSDWPFQARATPMKVDALISPRRKAKGGDKGSRGNRLTTRPARLATYAASWDTPRGTAGTDRGRLRESTTVSHRVKERTKGKGRWQRQRQSEQTMSTRTSARRSHADSATVSAANRDDNWIMALEREAPQADLSKETSFDVCSHAANG